MASLQSDSPYDFRFRWRTIAKDREFRASLLKRDHRKRIASIREQVGWIREEANRISMALIESNLSSTGQIGLDPDKVRDIAHDALWGSLYSSCRPISHKIVR